jgi:hypothetical protein
MAQPKLAGTRLSLRSDRRLIRKSAEKEMSGASAKDALLTAAGVQPGEVATLQRELQQAFEESKRWREEAAREHGQLEQSKIAC